MILPLAQKIIYPGLLKKIEQYKVTKDQDMPWVYQKANPNGRPLHDDWLLGKSTLRIDCAYKCPLPFKMMQGNATMVEKPIPIDYPVVPGTTYEIRVWIVTGKL